MFKIGKLTLGGIPRIAVSFRDKTPKRAIREAKLLGMDVAELRIDLFSSFKPSCILKEVSKFKGIPTIATIRSKVEGGKWRFRDERRLDLFRAVIPKVSAVDIELSSKFILGLVVQAARRARKLVIVSYHNFERTPRLDELNEILELAEASGADIVKIAAMGRNPGDFRTLARFTMEHASKGIITVAMGREAAVSRIVFPALGSLLTYAHFGKPTAPGQLDLKSTSLLVNKLYHST